MYHRTVVYRGTPTVLKQEPVGNVTIVRSLGMCQQPGWLSTVEDGRRLEDLTYISSRLNNFHLSHHIQIGWGGGGPNQPHTQSLLFRDHDVVLRRTNNFTLLLKLIRRIIL